MAIGSDTDLSDVCRKKANTTEAVSFIIYKYNGTKKNRTHKLMLLTNCDFIQSRKEENGPKIILVPYLVTLFAD